ncbi:MAG: transcriptional regulator [Gammaproteobacteria bacterium]
MDLSAYLKEHELTQDQFAKLIGVSQGLVHQWLKGRTSITPERAADIERATAGAVTARELRPDLAGIFGTDTPQPTRRRSGRPKQAAA